MLPIDIVAVLCRSSLPVSVYATQQLYLEDMERMLFLQFIVYYTNVYIDTILVLIELTLLLFVFH